MTALSIDDLIHAWDGEGVDGDRFVIGLTDPATLTGRSGAGRRVVGARSAGGRGGPDGVSAQVSHVEPPVSRRNGQKRSSRADVDGGVVVVPVAVGGW